MAAKTDETKTTPAQAPANEVSEESTLPAWFDIGEAASIAGADKAQSFYDEVILSSVGNLSDHHTQGVSLMALENAANDPDNSARATAQATLKRVKQAFAKAAKK